VVNAENWSTRKGGQRKTGQRGKVVNGKLVNKKKAQKSQVLFINQNGHVNHVGFLFTLFRHVKT
jgi:hypothetical protein